MVDQLTLQSALKTSIDKEIADRTTAHQARIARLRSAHATLNTAGVPGAQMPLVLLAHGDSWFDYPLDGNSISFTGNTDVIAHLGVAGKIAPLILNLSHYGDATTDEMGIVKQQRLIAALSDPNNWPQDSRKPDAILFSGGGNDVVGDQFCIYLDYKCPGSTGLNVKRFKEKLDAVRASYEDLFAFRDRYAAGVPIFGHSYDFPIPDGRHPPCAGPWLQPSLEFAGWTALADGRAIVRTALQQFQATLNSLANTSRSAKKRDNKPTMTPTATRNNFFLVSTQGTLKDNEWANELHPTSMGFADIAEKFVLALRSHFPGRI